MAITRQVLEDGERYYVVHIIGENDTTSTAQLIIDVSNSAQVSPNTRFGQPVRLRLDSIQYDTEFLITLYWSTGTTTTTPPLAVLAPGQDDRDYMKFGGINNPNSTGFPDVAIINSESNGNDYMFTARFTKCFTNTSP